MPNPLPSGFQAPSVVEPELRQVVDMLKGYLNNLVPIGQLMPFVGPSTKVPSIWLLCDGSQYPQDQYRNLYDIVGTAFNTGGETAGYFRVPDLRGRVPVGLDNMGGSDAGRLSVANTLGLTGGEEKHTLTTAELAAHVHGAISTAGGGGGGAVASWTVGNASAGNNANFGWSGDGTHASQIQGAAHNVMQPYILINWIVRAL